MVLALPIMVGFFFLYIPFGIEGTYPDTTVNRLGGPKRTLIAENGIIYREVGGVRSELWTYKRISARKYELKHSSGVAIVAYDNYWGLWPTGESAKVTNFQKYPILKRNNVYDWIVDLNYYIF